MRFHDWLFFPGQRVILHHLNVRFHTKHIMFLHCLPYCGMPFKAMPSTKTGPLYSMAGVLSFCHGPPTPIKTTPYQKQGFNKAPYQGTTGGTNCGVNTSSRMVLRRVVPPGTESHESWYDQRKASRDSLGVFLGILWDLLGIYGMKLTANASENRFFSPTGI